MNEVKTCTVEGCDEHRYLHSKTGKPHSGFCYAHHADFVRRKDVLQRNAAARLGLTNKKSLVQGSLEGDWAGLSRAGRKREMNYQRLLDGDAPFEKANTRTPRPPKRKKVPRLKQVTVASKMSWNDAAILKPLRYNAVLDHPDGCEFTSEIVDACEVCHIYARALAKVTGMFYSVNDPDNIFFAKSDINVAMDRCGHYLDPEGFLKVLPWGQHLITLDLLGVYDCHIEMTESRSKYAQLAMREILA